MCYTTGYLDRYPNGITHSILGTTDEVNIIVPGLGLCTARICFLVPGLLAPNTTALEILSMKLSLSMRDAQWLHIRKGGESILHRTW